MFPAVPVPPFTLCNPKSLRSCDASGLLAPPCPPGWLTPQPFSVRTTWTFRGAGLIVQGLWCFPVMGSTFSFLAGTTGGARALGAPACAQGGSLSCPVT